jgi:hypothetical protein
MAEPILWANKVRRQTQRRENGRIVVEKYPQTGTRDDYDSDTLKPAGKRFRRVLDSAGNVMFCPLTTAAADVDVTGKYALRLMAKWAALGWLQLKDCPAALLASGQIVRGVIASPEVLSSRPCEPGSYSEAKPCKCHGIEQAARQEINRQVEDERSRKYRTEADKIMAETRKENAELVKGVAEAVADAMREGKAGRKGKQEQDG